MKVGQGYRTAALLACLMVVGGSALAAPYHAFQALDGLGGSWIRAAALNTAGIVVGTATQPPNGDDPPTEPPRPARWASESATDLGVINNGPFGDAYGVNRFGDVVGVSFLPNGGGTRATLWTAGAVVDLGTLGGTQSSAYGIDQDGKIVGYSTTAGDQSSRATVWIGGKIKALKDLGGRYSSAKAIASNGFIAGYGETPGGERHALRWKGKLLSDLGIGEATGVNRHGAVAGFAVSQSGYVHAARWTDGGVVDLGTLGGDQSQASGINDAGDVVGWSSISGCCESRATLWRKQTIIDLNDRLDPAARSAGWVLVTAEAINRRGQISGSARNTILGINRGYLLTP